MRLRALLAAAGLAAAAASVLAAPPASAVCDPAYPLCLPGCWEHSVHALLEGDVKEALDIRVCPR